MSGPLYGGSRASVYEISRGGNYSVWDDAGALQGFAKDSGLLAVDPKEFPRAMTQDSMFGEVISMAEAINFSLRIPSKEWMYGVFPLTEVEAINDDEFSILTFDAPPQAPELAEGGVVQFTDFRTTGKRASSQFRGLGARWGDLVANRARGRRILAGFREIVQRACDSSISLGNQNIILAEKIDTMIPVGCQIKEGGFPLGTPERAMFEMELRNEQQTTFRMVKDPDAAARIMQEARQKAFRDNAEEPNLFIAHPYVIDALPSTQGKRSFQVPNGDWIKTQTTLMDIDDAVAAQRPVSEPTMSRFEKTMRVMERDQDVSLIGLSLNHQLPAGKCPAWKEMFPLTTTWSRLRGISEHIVLRDRTRNNAGDVYRTEDRSITGMTYKSKKCEQKVLDLYWASANCGRYILHPLNAAKNDWQNARDIKAQASWEYGAYNPQGVKNRGKLCFADCVQIAQKGRSTDPWSIKPDVSDYAGMTQAYHAHGHLEKLTKEDPFWCDIVKAPGADGPKMDEGGVKKDNVLTRDNTRMLIPAMGFQRTEIVPESLTEAVAASAERAVCERLGGLGGREDDWQKFQKGQRDWAVYAAVADATLDDVVKHFPKTCSWMTGVLPATPKDQVSEGDTVIETILRTIDDIFPCRSACTTTDRANQKLQLLCAMMQTTDNGRAVSVSTFDQLLLNDTARLMIPKWIKDCGATSYTDRLRHGWHLASPIRRACYFARMTSRPCLFSEWRLLDRNVRKEEDYGVARLNAVYQASPVCVMRSGFSTGRAERTPMRLKFWTDNSHRIEAYSQTFYHKHFITRPENIHMFQDACPEAYVGGHDFTCWHNGGEMRECLDRRDPAKSCMVFLYYGVQSTDCLDQIDFSRTFFPEEKHFHKGWYFDMARYGVPSIACMKGRDPLSSIDMLGKGLWCTPIAHQGIQFEFNTATRTHSDKTEGSGAFSQIDTLQWSHVRDGYTISGMKMA